MEGVTRSKWFIRLLALLFAFLLFLNANAESRDDLKNLSVGKSQAQVTNVPITLKYDEDKYFVYGYEESATVNLSSSNKVLLAIESSQQTRNFTVVADLTTLGVGTHEVPLKIENLSNGISGEIEPTNIYVTIEEKATMEMPVEFSLGNSQLKDGYSIIDTEISPEYVTVTAGANSIKSIAKVVAVLQVNSIVDTDISQKMDVYALDRDGNRISAILNPSQVRVDVKVTAPTKIVPLRFQQVGDYTKNVKNIELLPAFNTVEVSGPQESLDDLYVIDIEVDTSSISKEEVKVVKIPVASDLTVKPETVEVTIKPTLEEKTNKSESRNVSSDSAATEVSSNTSTTSTTSSSIVSSTKDSTKTETTSSSTVFSSEQESSESSTE